MNASHRPPEPQDLTVIGFDYGEKRIGVAIGQTVTATAQGIAVIGARQGRINWKELDELIRTWSPQHGVIGIPATADGKPTPLTRKIRAFGNLLKERFDFDIDYVDERLTSAEADHQIRAGAAKGKSQAKRVAQRDSVAAELILRSWLEHRGGGTI